MTRLRARTLAVALWACGATGLAPVTVAAAPAWTAYDDFAGSTLAPSRWWARELAFRGASVLEANRRVVEGRLRLEATSHGDDTRSEGTGSARNELHLAQNRRVTGLRAAVTMRSASLGGCAGNTRAASEVRARLIGLFFNAGTPMENSLQNEVFAAIQIYRNRSSNDPAGQFRVAALTGVCLDDACDVSRTLAFQEMVTGVTTHQAVQLSLAWDAPNQTFRFAADGVEVDLGYNVSDRGPSTRPVKRLETSHTVPHCEGTQVRVSSVTDFDRVEILTQPD